MGRYSGKIAVGDVLVTREGPWYVQWLIIIGSRMMNLPAKCNHAIIIHHRDPNTNNWIGIEGRPGGVGWVDVTKQLAHPLTNANNQQPKTEEQRYLIATAAERMLNKPYDWDAIIQDGYWALKWRAIFGTHHIEWKDGEIPGHVVCSSFADWAYEVVGLANPGGTQQTRFTFPAHWDQFMIEEAWK
jgi:hypothetical protein